MLKKRKKRNKKRNSLPQKVQEWDGGAARVVPLRSGWLVLLVGERAFPVGMCASPPSGLIRNLQPRLAAAESAHVLLEGKLEPPPSPTVRWCLVR